VDDVDNIDQTHLKPDAIAYRLVHFIWKRPIAKVLWLMTSAFWGGGAIALFDPAFAAIYSSAFAGLLYSVLFPPLVFLYLAIGWARQEIDAGRIVLQPADISRRRSVGGWSDPAADPLDPRSPNHSKRLLNLRHHRH